MCILIARGVLMCILNEHQVHVYIKGYVYIKSTPPLLIRCQRNERARWNSRHAVLAERTFRTPFGLTLVAWKNRLPRCQGHCNVSRFADTHQQPLWRRTENGTKGERRGRSESSPGGRSVVCSPSLLSVLLKGGVRLIYTVYINSTRVSNVYIKWTSGFAMCILMTRCILKQHEPRGAYPLYYRFLAKMIIMCFNHILIILIIF